MTRFATLAALVIALGAGAAAAQERHTVRLKEERPGDVLQRTSVEEETTQTQVRVGGQPQPGQERASRREAEFRLTVLEPAPTVGQKPLKQSRKYTKARETKDGQTTTLIYEGRTVLIEKQGEKFAFLLPGGGELSGPGVQHLERDFNERSGQVGDRYFMPRKPVRVGESYAIDAGPLVKDLAASGKAKFDEAQAKAQGTLQRAYKKDGRLYGVIVFTVEIPVTSIVVSGDTMTPVKDSRFRYKGEIDACIDGSAHDRNARAELSIDIRFETTGADGRKADVTIRTRGVQRETYREAK
jgi:hypothetical protein